MTKTITAFLSDVVSFLESEVLPEPYDSCRYFDNCVARANDQSEVVKIKNLSFCKRTTNGDVTRVNNALSDSEVHLEFHIIDSEQITDSWSTFLSQINIRLETPEIDTPPVLKWESTHDRVGNLKYDEWFGPDEEYIEEDISARDAIHRGVKRQLYTILPGLEINSKRDSISPLELKVMYEEKSQILDSLDAVKSR